MGEQLRRVEFMYDEHGYVMPIDGKRAFRFAARIAGREWHAIDLHVSTLPENLTELRSIMNRFVYQLEAVINDADAAKGDGGIGTAGSKEGQAEEGGDTDPSSRLS